MQDIMTFNAVSKSFGEAHALQNVSFSIPENSIFGLLGPNGAGKTTLIRIITKIFAADSGNILFKEEDIRKSNYSKIGYMPEEKGMYKQMKVGEHLIYLGRLKGLTKIEAREKAHFWLQKLDASDWWNKKLEDLSKGMQQKAQFIATVLHEPELLILDEPFSGLDPVNAELIKNEIYNLNKQGVTIIFSTHRMEQVEEICKNIVLINKGNKVIDGDVQLIKDRFKENKYKLTFNGNAPVESNTLFEVIQILENGCIVQLKENTSGNMLLQYFLKQNIEITSFYEILPTLNEIFIHLVKDANHV